MAEKKFDIHIWDLILSLLGMAAASAIIALASNGVLASHFLNLAFPVIIGIHLYRYFDLKKEFWQGLAGLIAYMIFRVLIIVVLLRGQISTFPEVLMAWYTDQPISFLPSTLFVFAWDIGFILISLAYFAKWIEDGWGKLAVKWTASFLLFGIPLWAILQWLFPQTTTDYSASFMNPANRDAFAQNILGKLSHPWIWVLLLLVGITIIVGVKTKKWGGVLTLIFLAMIVVVIGYLLLGFTSHFQTGRWPWEQRVSTGISTNFPTSIIEEGEWMRTTLRANCILDSGLGANKDITYIIVEGVVETKNGAILDANGINGTKNSPISICKDANLYEVIVTLDPETKGGWFPVGKEFKGEIPKYTELHFAVNIQPEHNRLGAQKFSVSIK